MSYQPERLKKKTTRNNSTDVFVILEFSFRPQIAPWHTTVTQWTKSLRTISNTMSSVFSLQCFLLSTEHQKSFLVSCSKQETSRTASSQILPSPASSVLIYSEGRCAAVCNEKKTWHSIISATHSRMLMRTCLPGCVCLRACLQTKLRVLNEFTLLWLEIN